MRPPRSAPPRDQIEAEPDAAALRYGRAYDALLLQLRRGFHRLLAHFRESGGKFFGISF